MIAQEVIWFINHKHGEQAYVVETEKQILIFTAKSKWIVQKADYERFQYYTLFHYNFAQGSGYHVQMRGYAEDFMVYYAVMHDLDLPCNWQGFLQSWKLYLLWREIESRAAAFEWLCG